MKNLFFLFLIFALLIPTAFAGSFPDVAEDHENYGAIEYLDDHLVINGYDDGTFQPDKLVNRAEAAKIIINAFGIENNSSSSFPFPDVPKAEWYFPYVTAGYENGIIDGYDDGNFRPEETVNLAETLKMIVLASGVELPEDVENDVFVDVSADVWYAPHALYARDHNIVISDDYGEINANQDMTRSYFAEVIYRMIVVVENDEEVYPLYTNWDTYKSKILPFSMKYDKETWEIIEHEDEVIFWRADKEFLQFSPGRIYSNSGIIQVTVDENDLELSKDQYFENLKLAFSGEQYTEFELDDLDAMEVLYSDERIVDWYVYLENGYVLAIYTEYGNGVLGFQLQRYIQAMLATLEYTELDAEEAVDYSELLSEIFENVLVESTGMAMLDQLPDKLIIETDTIGVGTGPVDYYYSEGVDYTFKYERASDLILDTREGETTAF